MPGVLPVQGPREASYAPYGIGAQSLCVTAAAERLPAGRQEPAFTGLEKPPCDQLTTGPLPREAGTG